MTINKASKQFEEWEKSGFSKSETPSSEAIVLAIGVLKAKDEYESIQERLENYKPKHSFTGTLQRMLIALGTASTLEFIDNALSEHKDMDELDELQIEMEVEMSYGAD